MTWKSIIYFILNLLLIKGDFQKKDTRQKRVSQLEFLFRKQAENKRYVCTQESLTSQKYVDCRYHPLSGIAVTKLDQFYKEVTSNPTV